MAAFEGVSEGHGIHIFQVSSHRNAEGYSGDLETLFGQLSLIGRLIEKNSQLYELQMKHFSAQAEPEMSSN